MIELRRCLDNLSTIVRLEEEEIGLVQKFYAATSQEFAINY